MTAATLAVKRTMTPVVAALLSLFVGAEIVRQPSLARLITAACIGVLAFVAAAQWPEVHRRRNAPVAPVSRARTADATRVHRLAVDRSAPARGAGGARV